MSGKWILIAVALVACLVCSDQSSADNENVWVVTVLEGPPGTSWTGTYGNDVSDSGYVGGGWFDADSGMHAAYWYKGKFHDLESEIGIPSGTDQSNVNSVNSKGLMGGRATVTDGTDEHAVLWDVKKGTVTDLHPSGDEYVSSNIYTVNASGAAVGWAVTDDGTEVAWVWPKGDSTGEALPGLSDYYGTRAYGINSSGMIVGTGQTEADSLIPFPGWSVFPCNPVVWVKKGKSYDFIDLRDDFGDELPLIRLYDVSEDGEAVGRGWNEDLYTSAWSWTAEDGATMLDDDGTGDASAWRAVGKYVAGGIGYAPLGSFDGSWVSDSAALWVNGELEIVATDVTYDDVTYPYVEASSTNKGGLVTGFCFTLDLGPPYLPLGWVAEKK